MKENIIIAGSSGAIGGEFIKLYANNSNVEKIIALSRKSINNDHDKIQSVEIDYNVEATLKNLDVISQLDSISKIIIATGILHTDHIKPEKSIDGIDEFIPKPRIEKFATPLVVPTSSRATFGDV